MLQTESEETYLISAVTRCFTSILSPLRKCYASHAAYDLVLDTSKEISLEILDGKVRFRLTAKFLLPNQKPLSAATELCVLPSLSIPPNLPLKSRGWVRFHSSRYGISYVNT